MPQELFREPKTAGKLFWEGTIKGAAILGQFAPTGFVSSTSGKISVHLDTGLKSEQKSCC